MKCHTGSGLHPDEQLGVARARQSHLNVHGRTVVQCLVVRPVIELTQGAYRPGNVEAITVRMQEELAAVAYFETGDVFPPRLICRRKHQCTGAPLTVAQGL